MSTLVEHIEREGRALSQRVLGHMYRDPFWGERYGERGRRHADEDSDFHLRYLSRALCAGDASVLRRYAVWLREVLNSRGMCTRHLDENFRLLAQEIAAQPWPERDRAVEFLGEARAALAWPQGDARTLQADCERIAQSVARSVLERRGAWRRDERGPGALRDDAANYISYLSDAVALADASTLVAHTEWFAAHLRSHGLGREDVTAFLESVRQAVQAHGLGAAVSACLDEATALA